MDAQRKKNENKDKNNISDDQAIVGKDGAGTWQPQYNPDSPYYDPNIIDSSGTDFPGKGGSGTYKPDDANFPGKDGSGTLVPSADGQIDYNDELHLMEYELDGIIEGLS